jgi:hypothetical protein
VSATLDLTDLSARRFFLLFAACFVVSAIPVLIVDTLPLVDYPNHLARMHIIAAYDSAPALRQFYALDWHPVPNLAMDLLVPSLARIMPLEWAGKLFILATLLLIAGGTAALHRFLFQRWSAWPLLAFLLLYNRSLLWGFGNFLFGVGLAILAFALWVGLRDRAAILRVATAVVLAPAVFFAHFFAFGAYALLIPGYELGRLRRKPRPTGAAALRDLGLAAVPFILPVAVFLLTRHTGDAGVISWSRFFRKFDLLFNIVDNYVTWFDILTLLLLVGLFVGGAMRRQMAMSQAMVVPLLVLCIAQIAMPNRIFGAAGVDHRMPLVLALALIGATQGVMADRRWQNRIAGLLALLFLARMAIITVVWIEQDRALAPMVDALAHLPPGSKLAVAYPPSSVHVSRRDPPMLHLAGLAVTRSDAFVPTLFADPGQQPLTLHPPYAALAAETSPDEIWDVLAVGQADTNRRVAETLRHYDFVLVVAPGRSEFLQRAGLIPRASIAGAQLFAIDPGAG